MKNPKGKVNVAPTSPADIALPAAKSGLSKYLPYLINAWIFIPALVYFTVVNKYLVNIPYQDDYNAILDFLTKFKAAGFGDKMALLFSQHSDHRILHCRIITILYYYIFRGVNFIHIIYIGNFQLVAIFILLVHFIKKAIPKFWNVVSLIVGICIFDLSSYENADFAMCGVVNYGVIMLFLLSLYFYTRPGRKNLIVAGAFEAICIFSSGGGIVFAACLTGFLLLSKDKVKLITGAAILVVCAALYQYHYQKVTSLGTVSELFSSSRDITFFLHMVGSHFSYENGMEIGVLLLVLLVVLFPSNLKLQLKPNTRPLVCILASVLGTMGTISVFRSVVGINASYWSRYLIYTHLLCALLFIFLWIKLETTKYKWYAAGMSALLLCYAYSKNYDYGEGCLAMTQRRLENVPYYYHDRKPADFKEAQQIEEAACKEGIYCIQENR